MQGALNLNGIQNKLSTTPIQSGVKSEILKLERKMCKEEFCLEMKAVLPEYIVTRQKVIGECWDTERVSTASSWDKYSVPMMDLFLCF